MYRANALNLEHGTRQICVRAGADDTLGAHSANNRVQLQMYHETQHGQIELRFWPDWASLNSLCVPCGADTRLFDLDLGIHRYQLQRPHEVGQNKSAFALDNPDRHIILRI